MGDNRDNRANFINHHEEMILFEGGNYTYSSGEADVQNPMLGTQSQRPEQSSKSHSSIPQPTSSEADNRQFSAAIAQSSVSVVKKEEQVDERSQSFEISSPFFPKDQGLQSLWVNLNKPQNEKKQDLSIDQADSSPSVVWIEVKKEKKKEVIEISSSSSSDEPMFQKKVKKEEQIPQNLQPAVDTRPQWVKIYHTCHDRTLYGSMVQHTAFKILYNEVAALSMKNNHVQVRFLQKDNVKVFQHVLEKIIEQARTSLNIKQFEMTYDYLLKVSIPTIFKPPIYNGSRSSLKLTMFMTLNRKQEGEFNKQYKMFNQRNETPQLDIFLQGSDESVSWKIQRIEWRNNQHENRGHPPIISLQPKLTAFECLHFIHASVMYGIQFPLGTVCTD